MKDDFFVNEQSRASSKIEKRKKEDSDFEDEVGLTNIDDMDLRGSEPETDEGSEAEVEKRETAAQKRLRLAKRYLQKIEEDIVEDGSFDAADIDRELISERLKSDSLEASGKMQFKISEKFKDFNPDVRFFKGNKKAHQLSVTSVAVSCPSQKVWEHYLMSKEQPPIFIYSGSKDGSIIKWNFWTGERLCVFEGGLKSTRKNKLRFGANNLKAHVGHSDEIYALATSSDGQYMASGGKEKTIHLWSVSTNEHLAELKHHRDSISGLAFRKGQNQMYSASFDRSIKLWNIDDRAYMETLFGHQDQITSLDTLSRERCLSSGARDRTVRLWKIVDESQLIFRAPDSGVLEEELDEEEKKMKASAGGSMDVVAMISEDYFVSGSDSGAISLWNVGRKKPLFTLANAHGLTETAEKECQSSAIHCHAITSLTAIPYSDVFASGSGDGFIRLWQMTDDKKKFVKLATVPMIGIVNSLQFLEAPCVDKNSRAAILTPGRKRSIVMDICRMGREVTQGRSNLYLIAGVGQEHRFGRWWHIKEAKNGIAIIKLI